MLIARVGLGECWWGGLCSILEGGSNKLNCWGSVLCLWGGGGRVRVHYVCRLRRNGWSNGLLKCGVCSSHDRINAELMIFS